MPEAPQIKRALVVKLRHHGDVLLTTPVFATLVAHGIEADALVYDDTASMLAFNADVSGIHCIGRGWRRLGALSRFAHYRQLYRQLALRGYDLIVHLSSHWHGAWLARLLAPKISVAPAVRHRSRIANRFWDRTFSFRYPVLPGNRRHTVEMHLDALRRIDIHPTVGSKALRFVPGTDADAAVHLRLAALGAVQGDYILIHPTSRWLFKTWSHEGMSQLIDALTARGQTIVLSAAPAQAELAWMAELTKRIARPVIDLSGQLDLKQLGALIAGARAFIGVDSVPMHMAAALGTPTVALFGPSGDVEWGPWQVPHRIVTTGYPCRPCGNDGCGGSKLSDCLTKISHHCVLAALDDLLDSAAR